MAAAVTVPRLGWNMDEGVFVGWLKADGEHVRAGEPLFALEGEKAPQEVEALGEGAVRIPPDGPKAGDRVAVGAVVGYLLAPGEKLPVPSTARERGSQISGSQIANRGMTPAICDPEICDPA